MNIIKSIIPNSVIVEAFTKISEGVEVGENTYIGLGVYISKGVIIGKNCIIENGTSIYSDVKIGDNVYIGANCTIGLPPEWKGKENLQNKGVLIKDNSRINGLVSIDSGVNRQTTIGIGCYLMKHSYIAHDVILNDLVVLSSGVKIGGHSEIGKESNLGMNAVVHQKCIVPERCMIGASAFIGKKSVLRPGYKYVGVPVRELGENIKK